MKRFGEIIKSARHEHGLTLERLAKKAGTHKGYISGMESGSVNPPSAKLVSRMARLLHLDDHDLLIRAHVAKAPLAVRDELQRKLYPGE